MTSSQTESAPRFFYVVFGVYSDRSGSRILGVYSNQQDAADRVELARHAVAAYAVNYAKVAIDRAVAVDLNP